LIIDYALPYFGTKRSPAVIIAYVIPGNIYPVIEDINSNNSFAGAAIKAGYQSHYVVTERTGMPPKSICNGNVYDELVIPQESQITPAFVIEIGFSGLAQLRLDWNREVLDPTNNPEKSPIICME